MDTTPSMLLLVPARRKNRWPGHLRLRFRKNPRTHGVFISRKEALFGVILLTLSVLALHWIVSSTAPAADHETPVAASAYRA